MRFRQPLWPECHNPCVRHETVIVRIGLRGIIHATSHPAAAQAGATTRMTLS
jgi:hypothetical protein